MGARRKCGSEHVWERGREPPARFLPHMLHSLLLYCFTALLLYCFTALLFYLGVTQRHEWHERMLFYLGTVCVCVSAHALRESIRIRMRCAALKSGGGRDNY